VFAMNSATETFSQYSSALQVGTEVQSGTKDYKNPAEMSKIPLKAWMFVFVFLCCVVLCR
jgi:hypothetical protein